MCGWQGRVFFFNTDGPVEEKYMLISSYRARKEQIQDDLNKLDIFDINIFYKLIKKMAEVKTREVFLP